MSKFMKSLAAKSGAQFARFTWNGTYFRLTKMPIEANMRAFEEAVMITRHEVAMINPKFKNEPKSEAEWVQIAESIGKIFFDEPMNRHEQLVQLAQLSAYGKITMIDCIKSGDGSDIYIPDEDEIKESGKTVEELISEARMEMFDLVTNNADLQGELRKASNDLVPDWMKGAMDRAAKTAPQQPKKKARKKR